MFPLWLCSELPPDSMNNLGANDNRSQTVGIFVTTRIPWVSQDVKAYINWLELKAVFLHSLTELWRHKLICNILMFLAIPMMHCLLAILMMLSWRHFRWRTSSCWSLTQYSTRNKAASSISQEANACMGTQEGLAPENCVTLLLSCGISAFRGN